MKGKPRGYAFVEFADAEVRHKSILDSGCLNASLQSAAKALNACHDKVIRGRKISVTYANQVSWLLHRWK